MKANELMIGDIVRVAKDVCLPKGTIVSIKGLDADNRFIEKHLVGSATCLTINNEDKMTCGVWVEYLEPIPLTPEILEKNGWVRTKYCYGRDCMEIHGADELPEGVDNALSMARWSIDKNYQYHFLDLYMWIGSVMQHNVHYVHQLQHAFRIFGIEEEIEL